MRDRLDRLANQVSAEDRAKIEAALAIRVPTTTQEEDRQHCADLDAMFASVFGKRLEPEVA